jgi:hypothetical protein
MQQARRGALPAELRDAASAEELESARAGVEGPDRILWQRRRGERSASASGRFLLEETAARLGSRGSAAAITWVGEGRGFGMTGDPRVWVRGYLVAFTILPKWPYFLVAQA